MLQLPALFAAAFIAVAFVLIGTLVLIRVIDARIGDLRNERDFLRAQLVKKDELLAEANEHNEALQRVNQNTQRELSFSDGALTEARRDEH